MLDIRDRRILEELQEDATVAVADLADTVGLSVSACWRRIKALEDHGLISRRVALIDRRRANVGTTVFVGVRTSRHSIEWLEAFRKAISDIPEIVEAYRLTGEMDYLLRVVVADMAHYSRFIMDTLLKHPSVQDCKTSFVLDRVKATTAVPV